MNCPFCKEEMEHGFLYSDPGGFPWYPEGEKPIKYIPEFRRKKKGGMYFGSEKIEYCEYDTLSMYICRKCKKGIVDPLTEKKSKLLI